MSQKLTNNTGRIGKALHSIISYIRHHSRLRLLLIVGPPVSILLLFFVFPILSMLWLSFQTQLPPGSIFTLENYRSMLQSSYVKILQTTLVLTIESTVIVIAMGYSLAYSIVRFSKYTSGLLFLVIVPFWTNYIIRMYAWINILQSGGVIDFILKSLGVIQKGGGYLYTDSAVLVGFVYIWMPLAVLPFYSSISNMDEDLIEAAKDLGAGPIKTFLTVTLPMTKGGIIAGTVLVAIPTFGSFITPTLLGGTNVTMIGVVIEQQFNQAFNWPFGSALGMVVTAVVVILLLAAVKTGGDLYGSGGDS